jgi:23S rRNA-/tRNA-specific pseudouridylate synthase
MTFLSEQTCCFPESNKLGFVVNVCLILSQTKSLSYSFEQPKPKFAKCTARRTFVDKISRHGYRDRSQIDAENTEYKDESDNLATCQPSFPPIKIIYEDSHILVVSKPGGMLVHRSKEATRDTIFLLQTLRDQLGGRQVIRDRPSPHKRHRTHDAAFNAAPRSFSTRPAAL